MCPHFHLTMLRREGLIVSLPLQLRQLGLREAKAFSQGHTASKGKDPGTNSDHLMLQVLLVLLMLN